MRPSALTVGCGLGQPTAMTAAKSGEVKAALKELVEEFLDTGYGPLMESVKRAFVRESDRLLPTDLIQMMYLSAFCMQYHRLRLEDALKRGRVAAQRGGAAAGGGGGIAAGANSSCATPFVSSTTVVTLLRRAASCV